MTRKMWTPEEILYLQENYPKFGAQFCSTNLGRSFNSIACQARILKLKSPVRAEWSGQELDILRKFYPKHGSLYCSTLVNRSKNAVILAARRLNLNKMNLKDSGIKTRVCKTCKTTLDIENFLAIERLAPRNYKCYSPHCNNCRKIINREKGRKHYKLHQKEMTEKARKRSKTDVYRTYINNYNRRERKNNKNYRLKNNCRNRINEALRNVGLRKSERTAKLIGCPIEELKTYLESKFREGMSWDNHSLHGWHIDHIRPCSSFNLSDPEQQKACFHYSNLQPLWAKENLSKGDKF